MAANFGKYPHPSPSRSEGNSSHGTGADRVGRNSRGTMGNKNAGATSGKR